MHQEDRKCDENGDKATKYLYLETQIYAGKVFPSCKYLWYILKSSANESNTRSDSVFRIGLNIFDGSEIIAYI